MVGTVSVGVPEKPETLNFPKLTVDMVHPSLLDSIILQPPCVSVEAVLAGEKQQGCCAASLCAERGPVRWGGTARKVPPPPPLPPVSGQTQYVRAEMIITKVTEAEQ